MTLIFDMAQYFEIKAGLQDFFRPYKATILPVEASIEQKSMEKLYWQYDFNFEIIVSTKRLARDNADAQLGNVEREIMRLICQYEQGQIRGVDEMFYRGQERIYGIDSNYAKSTWATRIVITARYHMTRSNSS